MTEFRHFVGYRARFAQEFARLEQPVGKPVRRQGIEAFALDMLPTVGRELKSIDKMDRSKPERLREAMCSLTDLSLELASYLYAAGAEHPVWRRWIALTAFGRYLTGSMLEAAMYATIAGEWKLLDTLPPVRLDQNHVSDQVIWKLIGGRPSPRLPVKGEDDYSEAWLQLGFTIPCKDHAAIERSLTLIADDWIQMSDGEWQRFEPKAYPNFEVNACAVAAIARRRGYRPSGLTEEQLDFLEPGLAEPEPAPLYPSQFQLPGSRRA